MQNVDLILKVDGANCSIVTDSGAKGSTPVVKIGILYRITLDLRKPRTDANEDVLPPLDYSGISSATGFYLAVDSDWNQSTAPVIYCATASAFRLYQDTAKHTKLDVDLPNLATQDVVNRLNNGENVTLRCEVAGYAASGSAVNALFCVDFSLQIRNRVYLGGTIPAAVSSNPDYLTAAEVQALIAEATRPAASNLTIGTVTGGTAAAAEITGTAPNQTLNLVLVPGTNGVTPTIDATTKHWKIGSTDTGVLAEGVNGTMPTLTINSDGYWCINGTATNTEARGPRGYGLQYDRSGAITDRPLYDGQAAGFKFAVSEVDQTAHTSTIKIYTKNSATSGDWSDAMTFVVFDASANLSAIEPVAFQYQANLDNIYFDLSNYPEAMVTGVEVLTAEGWQLLPYFSAYGIRKIIRTSANRVYLYFGSSIPTWTKGRIYVAQMIANATSFNGGTSSGSGGSEGLTTAKMYYGTINDGTTWRISDVTASMLTGSGMTEATSGILGKTAITTTAGSLTAVFVQSGYTAKKDDGFGGKTAFSTDNGASGTGANGTTMSLNGVSYKAYGEFNLISGTTYIYIDKE